MKSDARNMCRKLLVAVCGVVAVVMLASASYAGPINIVSLFPTYQGENGFYAHGYDGTTYRPLTYYTGTDYNHIFYTPGPTMPCVERPNSTLVLYPTYGEWAVYSYVVQSTKISSIQGAFTDASGGTTNTLCRIYVGDNSSNPLYTGSIASGLQTAAFNLSGLNIGSGQIIRFAVQAGGPSTNNWTALSGTFNVGAAEIPEPGTLATLAMGLVGTVLAIRRRK